MPGKHKIKGLDIEWLGHSTVKIHTERPVYIDPFSEVVSDKDSKACLIISTHPHRDHFDPDAINALSREETEIVVKTGTDTRPLSASIINTMEVNDTLIIQSMEIKAVHAYNTKRFRSPGVPFHPKGFGMGILLKVQGVSIYYAGDTDLVEEMTSLRDENIDIAFLPIGGKYTMNLDEAVEAAGLIQPKYVIPVHYNHIKGTEADPEEFQAKVEKNEGIEAIVL